MKDLIPEVRHLIKRVNSGLGREKVVEGLRVVLAIMERDPELEEVTVSRWWGDEHNEIAKAAGYRSWEDWVRVLQYEKRRKLCGAKADKHGERGGPYPCKKNPLKGRKRCREHRGDAPAGVGHPNYQGKGYSQVVPDKVRMEMEGVDLKSLLDLTEEMKVLVGHQKELMGRLGEGGGSREGWKKMNAILGRLDGAIDAGDVKAIVALVDEGREISVAQGRYDEVWDRIMKVQGHYGKMIDTHMKVLQTSGDLMLRQEALAMWGDLATAAREVILDPKLDDVLTAELRGQILSDISNTWQARIGADVRRVPVLPMLGGD